ncbi:Protein CLP1 [Phytophthora citrophthora]|uniref:Protein CLP1 n=1 Tax=Phytophthora citrophthora TaxID=4793 RepID=A0AAD9FY84_9STRA|nr:Protein CLP1 [Phytophthora citrophthora]
MSVETTEVVLAREGEYRVEVPPQTEVGIKLKSGSAELFGVELAIDREYTFRDRKLAIFTWYGCTLEVRGAPEVAYTSEETPMDSYLNIHAQLQRRRELAKAKHATGPRVLVCGPVDSGKSTLTQLLVNYALRLGEKPTLVELDVGNGCLSVPGTLSASPLDMNSLSIEEDYILTNPLAFFYGHAASSENVELFRFQQQQLAKAVKRRLTNDEEVNASGCVINTCGWVDGTGFDLLVHAIKDFEVDVVLVIGQDRLYSRLQSSLTGPNMNVVKLARSGGVVPLSSKLRSAARISCIREYFYGAHSLSVAIPTLSPCINEFSFEDVSFFAIKGAPGLLVLLFCLPYLTHLYFRYLDMKVSDVMLPVGQVETQSDRLRVVPVEKTADLGHSLAAVAHPRHGQDASSSTDLSWMLGAPAAGFVFMYVLTHDVVALL